uniref:FAM21/CAPZIP domain-containing protein n=1 Tax=Cyprinodon variegatus TaxID=28743 RepID=A0A3Q2CZR2_CYPVA
PEKQPDQTREQKEAELIPKMQEAISYGLKVLESAFEHLDIKAGNSESEDEEIPDKVESILEPKDLYADRPLPYLIGSRAFMEQDDVGLGDLSSDGETLSGAPSVLQCVQFGFKTIMSFFRNNTRSSSFAEELAARIKGEQVSRQDGDRASEDDSDDMFKPPKMDDHYDDEDDDEFSPFGGKSGLFSGGKGLFDDDDEKKYHFLFTDQWMNSNSSTSKADSKPGGIKTSTSAPSNLPSSKVSPNSSLFDDKDDDDLFAQTKTSSQKKSQRVSLLFEDEGDDDEGKDPLFGNKPANTGPPPKVSEQTFVTRECSETDPLTLLHLNCNIFSQPTEEQQQKTSTGVFQDEELLFSQTQQKDNDPDVDLFAVAAKTEVAHSLFSDDEEDDIFKSVKATPPPPVTICFYDLGFLQLLNFLGECQVYYLVKKKTHLINIVFFFKLQANLMINPAALLPGAVSSMSGTLSSSSGVSSSSLSPSPVSTPIGAHEESEGGVSFDTPVQVTTLQSAHKDRAKGSALRRPQSRAARQQAVKKSMGDKVQGKGDDFGPSPSTSSRPSELSLPVSANSGSKDFSKDSISTKKQLLLEDDDLFGSDSLFGPKAVLNNPPPKDTTKASDQKAASEAALKKEKDPSSLPSIFDDNTDDLFKKVKPQSVTKKVKTSPFMDDDDDDDDDIFGLNSSSTTTPKTNKKIKNGSSTSTPDIFQVDEATIVPKADKKLKEKSIDATLFDNTVDIFADLTDTFKPKQKSKLKGETKSIFDDDMDDIFTTSTAKPVPKAPDKSERTPPAKETSTASDASNIFDDPLNALGGN